MGFIMTHESWMKYQPEFTAAEFDCRCGCGLNNMESGFMDKLWTAREMAGIPFVITSGARCPAHNRDEGGEETSDHLGGHGADISARDSRTRFIILDALIRTGFSRIGIGQSFIHAGDDPANPPRVAWLY